MSESWATSSLPEKLRCSAKEHSVFSHLRQELMCDAADVIEAGSAQLSQALRELGEARAAEKAAIQDGNELSDMIRRAIARENRMQVDRDAALRSNAELRGALDALGNDPAVPAWIGTLARTALASSSTKYGDIMRAPVAKIACEHKRTMVTDRTVDHLMGNVVCADCGKFIRTFDAG